jgi:glutamyl-tRNA reductase
VGGVRIIIDEELERFRVETLAREVAPTISALRDRAEEIRTAEVARAQSRLCALDPEAAALVDQITNRVVNKLLHEPTMRLKNASGTDQGDLYSDALVALFALDEDFTSSPE